MKHIFYIVLITALVSAASVTRAQTRGVSLLRTGPGLAFFTGSGAYGSTPSFGFNIGVAPKVPLSEHFYLKPELALAKKGGRLEYGTNSIFSGSVKYRLYYLDCPVIIGVQLGDRWAIEGGGYSALKLGANFSFEGTFSEGYGTFSGDALKGLDYGLVGGVVFKSRLLHLGLRYTHGLTPVVQNNNLSGAGPLLGNAVNNTLQLTIQKARHKRFRDN